MMPQSMTSADIALSNEWLSQTDTVEAYYEKLRDQFNPGKPLWITETADAACGGNPWASTFLDRFRYQRFFSAEIQYGNRNINWNKEQ
jgi:heparanase